MRRLPASAIILVRSRSSGATVVRETAPATPPARRRSNGCLGGVMQSLRAGAPPSHSERLRAESRVAANGSCCVVPHGRNALLE
jgi:hypothetical protein